jgi:hypothetical protein
MLVKPSTANPTNFSDETEIVEPQAVNHGPQ